MFTGGLLYNETGQLVIESHPGESIWVGTPTPEMDRLWDHVESGMFLTAANDKRANLLATASTILLEGDEADSVRDKTTLIHGYWKAGLDVFHQLHCLVR